MRLAAWVLTPRLLRAPRQRHAEALGRLKTDYATYAACSGEIAVYGLAPQVIAELAGHGKALDAARSAIVHGEAVIQAVQLVLAAVTVAAVLASAEGGAALAALAGLAGAATVESWSALARTDMERLRVTEALGRLADIAMLPARQAGGAAPAESAITLTVGGTVHALQPGGRMLLAGPSGSGKSRLLGTLTGLRTDAPEGLVIAGQDVRHLGLEALRSLFSHAPQEAGLIAGTVADNLRLARPGVADAELWAALEVACLADTVRALPDGLDQWLGDNGARLSGGQRKRLALARALLAKRPWLVLDEPSEGLDGATESLLGTRLSAWLAATGTGLIIVSHREALRPLADQVVMLPPAGEERG